MPGPELRVLSANITALSTNWDLISGRKWDIALLQEVDSVGSEAALGAMARASIPWVPGLVKGL